MQLPKVSIVTITYNHENYILEALNSFLAQKYEGPIEVIIANDNSPDNTNQVISNFLATTIIPDNIEIKYTNHAANKGMMDNFVWALKQASGKYITFCEGDDYWIDPLKLQKQVVFLEKNKEYCFVSSNYKILRKGNIIDRIIDVPNNIITKEVYLKYWVFQLFTVLIRKSDINLLKFESLLIKNDTTLGYTLISEKKGFYFNDFFGVYRHHVGGVYSMVKEHDRIKHEYITYLELKNNFTSNKKINKLFFNSLIEVLNNNIDVGVPKLQLYWNLFINITKFYDFKQFVKCILNS